MKHNHHNKGKKIIWFTISALPLIVYLIMLCTHYVYDGVNLTYAYDFKDVLDMFGMTTSNVIVSTFNDIFTTMGFGDVFWLSGYLTWWLVVKIAHIMFDVLVFLPDVAHKFITKLEGEKDEDY